MRLKLLILLMFPLLAHGQYLTRFGATRATDTSWAIGGLRADGLLRLLSYASEDTNKVLGIDSRGYIVLRNKGAAGVDTAVLNSYYLRRTRTVIQDGGFKMNGSVNIKKLFVSDSLTLGDAITSPILSFFRSDSMDKKAAIGGVMSIFDRRYYKTMPAAVAPNGYTMPINFQFGGDVDWTRGTGAHAPLGGISLFLNHVAGTVPGKRVKHIAGFFISGGGSQSNPMIANKIDYIDLSGAGALTVDTFTMLKITDINSGDTASAGIYMANSDADPNFKKHWAYINNTGLPSYVEGTWVITNNRGKQWGIDSAERYYNQFLNSNWSIWAEKNIKANMLRSDSAIVMINNPRSVSSSDSILVKSGNTISTYLPVSAISGGGGGTGTVTSVSVSSTTLTTNVTNPTTTPAITINLPNTGTAGSYNNVTTDAQGRVVSGSNVSYATTTQLTNYVSKAGDTMTGALTINGANLVVNGGVRVGDYQDPAVDYQIAVINKTGAREGYIDYRDPATIAAKLGVPTFAQIDSIAGKSDSLNGQPASYYLNRANHTGTQTASTISDFTSTVQSIGDARYTMFTDSNQTVGFTTPYFLSQNYWKLGGNTTGTFLGRSDAATWSMGTAGANTLQFLSGGDVTLNNNGIFTVTGSSTNQRALYIVNASNSGAASHARMLLSVGGANSGDPVVSLTNGTTSYSLGMDNSIAGDPFVLSNNLTTVGTNNLLSIATNGDATLTGALTATNSTLFTTGTASGNGSATQIDITLPSTPTWVQVQAGSAAAANISYATPITNGVRIFYTVAPVSGTNNLTYYIEYR